MRGQGFTRWLMWALLATQSLYACGETRRHPERPGLVRKRDEPLDFTKKRSVTNLEQNVLTRYQMTFHNLHTKELLPYARPFSAKVWNDFLRCRVTGLSHTMHDKLFDIAFQMASKFDAEKINVVSGYRSPKFNEMLRKKGHKVASSSQHTLGHALDFQLPGVSARALASEVAKVHKGGIGTYIEFQFVHVDVGRNRRWKGK